VRSFKPDDLLDAGTSARKWDAVDLRKKNGSVRRGKAQWTPSSAATIYGFALWWECELLPGIALATNPLAARTHWEQLFCPVREPLHARSGAELSIELVSDSRYEVGATVKWDIMLRNPGPEAPIHQALDMKRGDMA
jgi:protein arginine N-methyltransferase 1